eukprot:403338157
MFKNTIEEALNQHPLKASVAKTLRSKIVETYPGIEEYLEEIWPKKAKVHQTKIKGESHVTMYLIDDVLSFMELRDQPIMPTLRILHKYPFMMPHMQCDKGAIKHIFSGSNVMAPGLTSPGGNMEDVEAGEVVAIMAEGKEHAMGVGIMLMSSDEIRSQNKGIAIELIQFLTDGLWKLTKPKE